MNAMKQPSEADVLGEKEKPKVFRVALDGQPGHMPSDKRKLETPLVISVDSNQAATMKKAEDLQLPWYQNFAKLTSLSSSFRGVFYILGFFVGASYPLVPTAKPITILALSVALFLIPFFWEKGVSWLIDKINHFLDADIRRRHLMFNVYNQVIDAMHKKGISNAQVEVCLTYTGDDQPLDKISYRLKIEYPVNVPLMDQVETAQELIECEIDGHALGMSKQDANQLLPKNNASFEFFVPMRDAEQKKQAIAVILRFFKRKKDLKKRQKKLEANNGQPLAAVDHSLIAQAYKIFQRIQAAFKDIGARLSLSRETYDAWIYKLKQFMNVVAIAAGFLFIQECLQFWFKSQPLLIMAYTIAAVVACISAFGSKENQEGINTLSPSSNDNSSFLERCSNFTRTPFFKKRLLPSVVFCACFYGLPLFPSFFKASWSIISMVLFLVAAAVVTYKINYEYDLRLARNACEDAAQRYQESLTGSLVSGTPKSKTKLEKCEQWLGNILQFSWEFIRTAFPLAFALDFLVTKCGGATIGVVQMNFASMTAAPLSVLMPELLIVTVLSGIFAYSMVTDTAKERVMDDAMEAAIPPVAAESVLPPGGTVAAFQAVGSDLADQCTQSVASCASSLKEQFNMMTTSSNGSDVPS